jgi:predicted neutral ceramidase superfamily lipid hydrolase
MLSPIWISWSFHANPVAKFDSIKCLHHHFLFSSLLGYKLYNLDDIQNFFLLIVVYDIHSALNIEFKVYNQIFLNVGSRIILFTLQITTLEKQVTKKSQKAFYLILISSLTFLILLAI